MLGGTRDEAEAGSRRVVSKALVNAGGHHIPTQGATSPGASDNQIAILQETEGDEWQRATETRSHLSK